MIYQLSFRGPGGAVVPAQLSAFENGRKPIPRELALADYPRVTFLIHGFNVDGQAGRTSLSRLAEKLAAADPEAAIVFVLWPGDSPIGPLSYPFTEGNQAIDTAKELTRFITAQVPKATPINFVAHSLGCRVVQQTAKNLYRQADGEKSVYPLDQLCLFAAAADDYSLSIPGKYRKAVERANRVVILSSLDDKVLKGIYPVGDLVQSFLFFWNETFGLALGYHGPRRFTTERRGAGRVVRRTRHDIAGNVVSIVIEDDKVGHGDYLPPSDDKPINDKQIAAEKVTIAALADEQELSYSLSSD